MGQDLCLGPSAEGERQHLQRRASGVWSWEFGGKVLGEGVWVGFRPSALEGVSECRGRALSGGVGAGLGLCATGGRL